MHGWPPPSARPAFFMEDARDIGRSVTIASQSAPGPLDFQRLLEIAHAYGYWLGNPTDNAAVGLPLR
jgi:hypothetical protein